MSSKKSIGLILVVLAFVLVALTGIRTISSPETFTHIALGQADGVKADPLSYTMTDEKWITLTPLYDNISATLWNMGGGGLVTIVHAAVFLIALGLFFRLGKAWGGPICQSMSLLLCAWLILPVFNPTPAVFALLFTALFITLMYKIKNFNILAAILIVLQILWTNMHPSFLFGPLLIVFFAIENSQDTRSTSRTKLITPLTNRLFGLAAITLLVTVINPNMINLHRHLIANAKLLTGTEGIEWISLFSNAFPQNVTISIYFFALILGAGGLVTLQKKLPLMLTLLALTGALLTVGSIGSLLSFAALSLPFMILSFSSVSEYLSRTLTTTLKANESILQYVMTGLAALLVIITIGSVITNSAYVNIGSASQFGLGVEEESFPVAAAGILDRKDFPNNILNLSHDGGYIAVQNPNLKVFCDTRSSFYGEDFYRNLELALRGERSAWTAIQSEWNPEAVVINGAWPDSGALANRLISNRNAKGLQTWKLIYFDGATIILVKNLPEYATLINDPTIQQYGIKILEESRKAYVAQNKGLIKSGNSSRLIGASSLYLALRRPVEAEALFRTLTKNCPNMSHAWLGLGQSLIYQKQLTQGIGYMEKAASITPRSAQVWMGLYQAYNLQGNKQKANEAAEKLNKFFQAEDATVEQKEITKKKGATEEVAPAIDDGMELPSELK